MTVSKSAWTVVLTSSNAYIKGVMALKYALHNVHKSRYPLLVLYTSTVVPEAIDALEKMGCETRLIDPIQPSGKVHYKSKRFSDTWTKLAVWDQVDYERLVLLDADMLPLQNMDELMELKLPGKDWAAACHACICNPQKITHYPPYWVPDNCVYTNCDTAATQIAPPTSGHANYFNSGLIVLTPSTEMFDEMMLQLFSTPDLDIYPFPDQDFLNAIFQDHWLPLPYSYNALKTLQFAHKRMWDINRVKNIHYIIGKPWDTPQHKELRGLEAIYKPLYKYWWDSYSKVKDFVNLERLEQIIQ